MPRIRLDEAKNQIHQRGFARATFTLETNHRPVLDLQIYLLQCWLVAGFVFKRHIMQLNGMSERQCGGIIKGDFARRRCRGEVGVNDLQGATRVTNAGGSANEPVCRRHQPKGDGRIEGQSG